ncbi:MAG: hypothetical protein KAJ98_14375 [Spirochaetaceae bacterium]|nr:hypothetical protein [Spirochaetaceae bacterium]
MNVIFGAIITAVSSFGFIGQLISTFRPGTAVKLGVMERESDVDPVFHVDVRGEAAWDTAILWTLPLAGVLLMKNIPGWVYFGLIGGGMYLYFAGRGIIVRIKMLRRGIRIGNKDALIGIFVFLSLWGLVAILAIVLAVIFLRNEGGIQ